MATKATETVETPAADVELYDGDATASSDARREIEEFKTGNMSIHSSFRGDDFFEVAKAQLAATSGSVPLADNLGTIINLDNYVLQHVEIPDEKTGELQDSIRVTLSDSAAGKSYHATSVTLARSLKGIINALGGKEPHEWPAALPIKVVESKSRKGFRFMEIVVVL